MKQKVHNILIIAVGALFLFTPLHAIAANFSDVSADHPNQYAIQVLKDASIVGGYPDGTFKPDAPVNRAETVAIMLKTAGINSPSTSTKMPFTDVDSNEWYYPMIQKAVELKKVKGYEDGTFHPEATVSFAESLALTTSFLNMGVDSTVIEPTIYEGINTKEWYAKFFQFAKDRNIFEPDATGVIDPNRPLTRGQLAEIIYRSRIVKQTGIAFDMTSGWKISEHPENNWRMKHPSEWEVFRGQMNSVLWKRLPNQAFYTTVWPRGVQLSISTLENSEGISAATYFNRLRSTYKDEFSNADIVFTEMTVGGRSGLKIFVRSERSVDMALSLPSGAFLMMYGKYGSAPIGEYHRKVLETAMASYQFVEKPAVTTIPIAERLARLREAILVEGKADEVLPLFPDKKLIETDAIGAGAGPIDYWYTAEANQTIKSERNSKTILNIREGSTSQF